MHCFFLRNSRITWTGVLVEMQYMTDGQKWRKHGNGYQNSAKGITTTEIVKRQIAFLHEILSTGICLTIYIQPLKHVDRLSISDH